MKISGDVITAVPEAAGRGGNRSLHRRQGLGLGKSKLPFVQTDASEPSSEEGSRESLSLPSISEYF